ncbi:hypothetical protein KP509_38G046100 [Ceratopteris richardii]|nr:hypothetical protein KP509_38G046100 [Ceratopteris richardii]
MFAYIYHKGLQPQLSTYIVGLSACTKIEDLDDGRLLHACILEDEQKLDNIVCTSIINMYGKCEDLESALHVSNHVSRRDTVVWNALISVYVQHEKGKEALSLLVQMQQEGLQPSRVTYVNILTACSSKGLLTEGKQIHCFIIDSKCDTDTIVGTTLLNMYSKCGSVSDAKRVFDNLCFQDQISWNSMIGTYVEHGFRKEALQLFEQMHQVVMLADKVTFVCILDGCVEPANLQEINRMHASILSMGLHVNIIVATALIKMYGKCTSSEGAQQVFDSLLCRDLVTWNAMLNIHAEHNGYKQTSLLFARMQLESVLPCRASFASALSALVSKELLAEGKRLHVCLAAGRLASDIVLGNALVNMYGKCECLDEANKVFIRLAHPDVVSWNTLISVCSQLKHRDEAWQLFKQMQVEGLQADKFTLVSILDSCTSQANLLKGKLAHICFLNSPFYGDIMVGSALVTMYGKCGSLGNSERAFESLPRQNIVSWHSFIGTLAQHGKAKETIHQFQRMKKTLSPDKVTFTIILNACSHAGLVDEAWDIFSSMTTIYRILPTVDHYACMIDLLGRVGRLAEAESLLQMVPHEKNAVLYNTLLSACMQQSDVERGEHVANVAFKFDLMDPAPLVMLSNIYSAAGKV